MATLYGRLTGDAPRTVTRASNTAIRATVTHPAGALDVQVDATGFYEVTLTRPRQRPLVIATGDLEC